MRTISSIVRRRLGFSRDDPEDDKDTFPPKYREQLPLPADADMPFNRLRALRPVDAESAEPDGNNFLIHARLKELGLTLAEMSKSGSLQFASAKTLSVSNIRQITQEAESAGMDDLACRELHNSLASVLHRLPEAVVVDQIMARLDWLSLLCLRHASRRFMRLFSGHPEIFDQRLGVMACSYRHNGLLVHDAVTGSRENDGRDGQDDYAPPWATMAFPIDYKSTWPAMKATLSRDLYDSRQCRRQFVLSGAAGGGSGSFQSEYMHCHKCNADHPTRLFSASACALGARAAGLNLMAESEQAKPTPSCIAHEGHVRICEHKTVTYAEVLASLPGGRLHEDYEANKYRAKSLGLVFVAVPTQPTPIVVEPYLELICDHPSHIPKHHIREPVRAATETLDSRRKAKSGSTASGDPKHTDNDMQPPTYKRFSSDNKSSPQPRPHDYYPSFSVHDVMTHRSDDTEDKHKVITWSYTAHVDLSSCRLALTAQEFRDAVDHMRAGQSPARYIAPEDHPGILQELRCVDPNRCTCLNYPGLDGKNRTGDNRNSKDCREHNVVRKLYSRVSDIDSIQTRLDSCDDHNCYKYEDCIRGRSQKAHRCVKITYTRTIRLATEHYSVDASPQWKPAVVYRGQGLGRRQRMSAHELDMRLADAFRNSTVAPYGWYQALDTSSYEEPCPTRSIGFGFTAMSLPESERYQVTWCRGSRCRLNPRFLREHFVSGQEINAACIYGCCGGPGSAGAGASLSSSLPWNALSYAPMHAVYMSTVPPVPFPVAGVGHSEHTLPHFTSAPFEYPLRDQWKGWLFVKPRPTNSAWLGQGSQFDYTLLHDKIDYEGWEKTARESTERQFTFMMALEELKDRAREVQRSLGTEVERARARRDAAETAWCSSGRSGIEDEDGALNDYRHASHVLQLREQALEDAKTEDKEYGKAVLEALKIHKTMAETLRLVRQYLVCKNLRTAARGVADLYHRDADEFGNVYETQMIGTHL